MESSAPPRKLHLVFVPYPSQGHITPMMQLANLLHSRGFHITFVHTDFNYRRLLRSRGAAAVMGLPGFQFEAISDGLPPSDADATQDIPALCESTRKYCLAPFRQLLLRLASTDRVPAVTGIVSDGTMTFAIEAAKEIGVAELLLWTASACSFMGYLHYRELVSRGIFPFKDANFMTDGTLDTPIDWIPGMRNIRLKDLPSHIRTTDPNYIMFDFMGEEAHNCLKAQTIILNTFDALEHEVLEAIAAKFPHIYTIGPLPMLCRLMMDNNDDSLNPSLWKEDSKCIEWLDQREPNSVVYVNYGSVTVMSGKNFREFAWGLAKSNHPFLWVIRPDIVMGGDDKSTSTALSEEFFEEIKGRGLLVSWCSQLQVLRHASVGVFLTHCGWNSTLESISEGLPVICWPFFADQQTNCRYACAHWGIGMELDNEVNCDEVASIVKEMMEGNGGKKMRSKAKEWKEKAEEAIGIGGSSYNNFDKLMKELVL